MTHVESSSALESLARHLVAIPPGGRGEILWRCFGFAGCSDGDDTQAARDVASAVAALWEALHQKPIFLPELRDHIVSGFGAADLAVMSEIDKAPSLPCLAAALSRLFAHLGRLSCGPDQVQLTFFDDPVESISVGQSRQTTDAPSVVTDLSELVMRQCKFATIYADPPWPYDNKACRGAAVRHYQTMSVEEICSEPVSQLVADNAHLHLWTTNGFLRESLDVIDAWGFTFKSCLVWVKPDIGLGNYWRVSHEFLLLGVRGNLPFRNRRQRSWIQTPRTVHSRKPGMVRLLIEKVSPGPYLELYGREEIPNSPWTVYGNQVEERFL